MNQEIIEKYLMIRAEKELTNYQLRAMIQEIADTRPIREYKLWMQIKDAI
jgi:hypothetical protein